MRVNTQKGSTTFFFAFFVLPVLFFALSLTLDLSVYFSKSDDAQRIIDDAALYAYKFLPSQGDAKGAAELYLMQNIKGVDGGLSNSEVSVNSNGISILFRGQTDLSFARFFGVTAGIPYAAYAETRSTPLDVYLAIDSTAYLAPDVLGSEAWGSDSEWPAADFFLNDKVLIKVDSSTGLPTGERLDARLATQQCFNPVLSVHKRAAIQIYDYLSNFSLNSIGVGFYPGYVFALDDARSVESPGIRRAAEGEADFDDIHGGLFNSSLFCAAAAERENHHIDYNFPSLSSKLSANVQCGASAPASLVNPVNWSLEEGARTCIQARQVIWSRVVNNFNIQKFDEVLQLLSSSLISAPSRIERGGLINQPAKVGIILAGDLPSIGLKRFPDASVINALRQELLRSKSDVETYRADFNIYYVLYRHQGVTDLDWDENIRKLQNLFDEINANQPAKGKLNIRLMVGDSPLQIMQEALSNLLISKQSVVLSS